MSPVTEWSRWLGRPRQSCDLGPVLVQSTSTPQSIPSAGMQSQNEYPQGLCQGQCSNSLKAKPLFLWSDLHLNWKLSKFRMPTPIRKSLKEEVYTEIKRYGVTGRGHFCPPDTLRPCRGIREILLQTLSCEQRGVSQLLLCCTCHHINGSHTRDLSPSLLCKKDTGRNVPGVTASTQMSRFRSHVFLFILYP